METAPRPLEPGRRSRTRSAAWWGINALAVFAVFGVVGLAVAWPLRRKAPNNPVRHAAMGVVWVVFALLAAGSCAKLAEEARGVAECQPPPEIENYAREQGEKAAVSIGPFATAMTWPTTGLLVTYAELSQANLCYFEPQEFYLARFGQWPLPRRAIFVANVLLARNVAAYDVDRGLALTTHEVKHRNQWAVSTLIGGPLAFPVAYTVDDFFFPGSANHFERAAGLESGGYDDESSPRLRLAEMAFFSATAVGVGAAAFAIRRWRRDKSGASG